MVEYVHIEIFVFVLLWPFDYLCKLYSDFRSVAEENWLWRLYTIVFQYCIYYVGTIR